MLSLNGEVLRLDSMTVAMRMELKDQDMSGQSSSTDKAEQGDKGKTLSFTGTIAFKNVAVLTRLYQLASAKDDNDNRAAYRIGNDTARSLKIRDGKFTGSISAMEHNSLLAWNVSFELREHNGVAEQKENRKSQQTKPQQTQNTRHQQALKDAEASGL
jgi:hypothetical protein